MKRPDGFMITIIGMLLLLAGLYYSAQETLGYFDTNHNLKMQIERKKKISSLMRKLESIEKINSEEKKRSIASIPEAADVMPVLDSKDLAQSFYKESKLKCYEAGKENECLSSIDKVVTHFPESEWAGESLLILSDFYYRTHRHAQAKDIVRILKVEFKNNKSIQNKVSIMERALL